MYRTHIWTKLKTYSVAEKKINRFFRDVKKLSKKAVFGVIRLWLKWVESKFYSSPGPCYSKVYLSKTAIRLGFWWILAELGQFSFTPYILDIGQNSPKSIWNGGIKARRSWMLMIVVLIFPHSQLLPVESAGVQIKTFAVIICVFYLPNFMSISLSLSSPASSL